MDFSERLKFEGIDYNNYHSLYKRKRRLISYINASNTYFRFSMLKVSPPKEVIATLEEAKKYGFTCNADIHKYIDFISVRLKELKEMH